jgi:hypothetical protein
MDQATDLSSAEPSVDFDYLARLAQWLPPKRGAARRTATSLWLYSLVILAMMLFSTANGHRDYVSVGQSEQMAILAFIVWLPCGVLMFAASSVLLARCTRFVADNMRACHYLVREPGTLAARMPGWLVCRVLGVDTSSGQADTPEREGLAALNEYYGCCFRHERLPFPPVFIQAEVAAVIVLTVCIAAMALYIVRHIDLSGNGALAEAIYGSFVGFAAAAVYVTLSSLSSASFLTALGQRLDELQALRTDTEA